MSTEFNNPLVRFNIDMKEYLIKSNKIMLIL